MKKILFADPSVFHLLKLVDLRMFVGLYQKSLIQKTGMYELLFRITVAFQNIFVISLSM